MQVRFVKSRAPEPSHLLIENVAILPDWQGKGIGGVLLGHAETIARSLQLNEMRLYSNALFLTNISCYAHRGFSEFLREHHARWGGVVHMKKPLEPLSLHISY
jgi:GNAT superfamily N-acetyltransferase